MYHGFHKNTAYLFPTLIIIRNVSLAPNQHIQIISEGSCDTEDWRVMAAENPALLSLGEHKRLLIDPKLVLNNNNITKLISNQ